MFDYVQVYQCVRFDFGISVRVGVSFEVSHSFRLSVTVRLELVLSLGCG